MKRLSSLRLAKPSGLRLFSSSAGVKFTFNRPFKGHKLEVPESSAYATKEELIELYTTMAYYRRFEIAADIAYKNREIRGFCHLYDGQEAICTGMEASIRKTDSVITAYRCHTYQLGRGDTGESVMAELMAKQTGCSKGKGGSMHLYYPKHNFYGGNGIVGAQVPIGAGLAMAHKYKKDGGIAIAGYGDGAANQGQVFEAANMAALWKLPIIFLCENNEYGMGTSTARHAASKDGFYTRGDYVPGIWVDGMDVLACKKGFAFAAEYCRSGKGPIFMECNTYRYHGHSMSDPGVSYRSREEVANVRAQRDPIEMTAKRLIDNKFATDEELKEIDKKIRKQVDEEVKKAQAATELPVSEAYTHIYSGTPMPFIRASTLARSVTDVKY